jgi:hypothetical protein
MAQARTTKAAVREAMKTVEEVVVVDILEVEEDLAVALEEMVAGKEIGNCS